MIRGIRFKLTLATFVLVLFTTGASSFIVINIMDGSLLGELIKRGLSITESAATVAGYSIISNDRVALDNLALKIKEQEKDISYVAIVDDGSIVKAHSDLTKMGEVHRSPVEGIIRKEGDGSAVKRVTRNGRSCYEFQSPIIFSGRNLGAIYLGIYEDSLIATQRSARNQILLVSSVILVFGVTGVFFLSTFITSPVKQLMDGISKMKSGEATGEIKVVSRDELGELTRNFNEMTRTILDQRIKLEDSARELEEAYLSTVKILAAAIDARDEYTFGHSERVARMSVLLGRKMGLSEEEIKDLEIVCLFHDVGKIQIPDRILHKKRPLSDEEYRIMMKHPEEGAEILKLAGSLKKYVPAVLHHHEWYNGKGYPGGLKKGDIPLFASIIAITDAYDAMTSSRPYRRGMSIDKTREEILKFRGVQFAPEVTDLFLDLLKDEERFEKTVSVRSV